MEVTRETQRGGEGQEGGWADAEANGWAEDGKETGTGNGCGQGEGEVDHGGPESLVELVHCCCVPIM